MRAPVTVACVQAEPVIFDRAATVERVPFYDPEKTRTHAP